MREINCYSIEHEQGVIDDEHNRTDFQLFELNDDRKHAFYRLIKYLQLPVYIITSLDEGCDIVLSGYDQFVCLVFAETREGW